MCRQTCTLRQSLLALSSWLELRSLEHLRKVDILRPDCHSWTSDRNPDVLTMRRLRCSSCLACSVQQSCTLQRRKASSPFFATSEESLPLSAVMRDQCK